jgi:hypothetical protein
MACDAPALSAQAGRVEQAAALDGINTLFHIILSAETVRLVPMHCEPPANQGHHSGEAQTQSHVPLV